jgi:glycosyltransferase involved in cell wall biosynthesis
VTLRVFPNLSNTLAYRFQLFLPLGLDQYLREHAGEFDIAHLHACRNVPGVIAARHLLDARVPYVLEPNGTAPVIEQRKLAKRGFDAVAGRRVLANAARLVAVSDAERLQLLRLRVDPAAIRLVPNPIDLDEFARPIPRGHLRRKLGVGSEQIVMFLGKITPRKRVDVLARAFARLNRKDTWLVIAGNDIGTGKQLRELTVELGIESRTRFAGLLRGDERLQALADADVVVYPSQHEIFGLVPLEALLAGSPVVVADDSGCGEVVRTVGGGLVTPLGDVERLAGAIGTMLDAGAEWRSAAARAADRVRAQYGDRVVCDQLEQVYNEVLGER